MRWRRRAASSDHKPSLSFVVFIFSCFSFFWSAHTPKKLLPFKKQCCFLFCSVFTSLLLPFYLFFSVSLSLFLYSVFPSFVLSIVHNFTSSFFLVFLSFRFVASKEQHHKKYSKGLISKSLFFLCSSLLLQKEPSVFCCFCSLKVCFS